MKRLNLALQGGGSHGAFTWGVLDRLLDEPALEIAAISGTSAGAMNAVVMANGLAEGGRAGAQRKLADFWGAVANMALISPIRRTFLDRFMGKWTLDYSPTYLAFNMFSRYFTPSEFNPFNINPLKEILLKQVNFEQVNQYTDTKLFLSATNVETGQAKVFGQPDITDDVVLASACLPYLFHAVEIDGVPYWDGGYAGNPPLFPLFNSSVCNDIAIIQINPLMRSGIPRTAPDIHNRLNEIVFNQSLVKELRAIEFVQRLLSEGKLDEQIYHNMYIHVIENQESLSSLGASSKVNAEWRFLKHLRNIGRATAETWLTRHYDKIGVRSTLDVQNLFKSYAPEGTAAVKDIAA